MSVDNAGRLRHRIAIEDYVDSNDGGGGATRSWTTVAECWAEIQPISADERWQAERLQMKISHRVTIRYREGISPGMRVVFDQRALRIQTIVNPAERNRSLILMCEELS